MTNFTQYLRNWFNNRTANKRKMHIKAQPQILTSRSHQPVEVYSRQFYKEKIKPLVTTELAENEVSKSEKLGIVKKVTRAAFDAESEDVREAIFAQANALKAENAARRADARKSESNPSPEGYARHVVCIIPTCQALMIITGQLNPWHTNWTTLSMIWRREQGGRSL